jgi:hypothetical protein
MTIEEYPVEVLVPFPVMAVEDARRQVAELEQMRARHLASCGPCQRQEPCDVIRGYDCALAMFCQHGDPRGGAARSPDAPGKAAPCSLMT